MNNSVFRFFSLKFARRLSRSAGYRRSNIATIIATIGVTLSLITIILTLSIVEGFRKELKNKILLLSPSIYIVEISGDNQKLWEESDIILDVLSHSDIENYDIRPVINIGALVKSEKDFLNLILMPYDELLTNPNFATYIVDSIHGYDNIQSAIFISSQSLENLKINLEDKVDIIIPDELSLKFRRAQIAGTFNTYFEDFDKNFALIHPDFFKYLKNINQFGSARIEIRLSSFDEDKILQYSQSIQQLLNNLSLHQAINGRYYVSNIIHDAGTYLGWLSMMDTNIIVITILMIIISVFTLISSLTIIILEHIPLIGVLKSLGASSTVIRDIFILIGSKILIWAIIISNVISIVTIYTQNHWHLLSMNPDTYYLTHVPMVLDFKVLILVNLSAVILGLLSMLLPTFIINKVSATQIIKFT